MKTVSMIVGLVLAMGAFAGQAQAEETIIAKKTVQLAVDLSQAGVRSSNAGYGTTYLVKILVPGLAAETLLNHRNEGESAPCLATYETRRVEDVIKNNPATETYTFEIVQKKVVYPDVANNTCSVWLVEDVHSIVRGFNFVHNRSTELPARHIDDCK
ncbi:hypothetical protein [Bdellovibrio bacteriovorus]|uniref:hypothetical protein n=1 Tax=Bdellovibrio TaxID=958 RepID=UPI0035A8F765